MRISILFATFSVAVMMVCPVQTAEAAGKPKGGGPSTGQILPVSLGASSNCTGSYGLRINDGVNYPLQVVGQGSGCTGSQPRPVRWSASTGMVDLGTMGRAAGGSAESISNDGTVVGWLGGGVGLAFVLPFGGVMQELPMLDGMEFASAEAISANGSYIVGWSSTDTEGHSVRWDRLAGTWQPLAIPGGATAVTDSGAVVGSDGNGRVRIWTEKGTVTLPGIDARAHDVNSAGTVVVGFRWQACPEPCGMYEVPMVWTLRNGTWNAQELQALDGVDSEAYGVGEVNGQTIIVGYGYTRSDSIMRAVVWKPDAQGKYAAPLRLGALNGRSSAWARAADVNASGYVVGTSAGNGLSVFAVRWKLP